MARFPQPSMSRGELAPGLQGRTDLAAYQIGLAKCRNVITKPTGGAAKRSGTFFRGRAKYPPPSYTRMLPFVYSTGVRYMVEAGDGYFRFWVGGSLLTSSSTAIEDVSNGNPAVVTATAHGLQNGEFVLIRGVRGLDRVNSRTYTVANATANTFELQGFNTSLDAAYTGGGVCGRVVEVVTPYTANLLPAVRFTQSADVMTITHGDVPTKDLRRLTATSFELVDFDYRRGPFRPFNSNEADIIAVSGNTGNVTISTNVGKFDPEMVGQLIYLEEKELRGIKPWASSEQNIAVGSLRRSDQKVYRVASVPSTGGGAGTPYYITGGSRPTHSVGRAFDGPQDKRNDGVNDYWVGVEWEFVGNVFGIVKITGVASPTSATGVVVERIPDSIVGVAPSPVNTWTFSGDGSQVTFAVTGATSYSVLDYTVTINGVPVQSNPFYPGGGGVSGGGGGDPRPGNPNTNIMMQLE